MEYKFLLGELETILGKGYKKSKDNYAFHCPVCNHRKPKLEVKLPTNNIGENPWECWVCAGRGTKMKGKSIKTLLERLKVPEKKAKQVLKYIHKGLEKSYKVEERTIALPSTFRRLIDGSKSSIPVQRIIKYLNSREIYEADILRYNLGYHASGKHQGKLIVPSYDSNNVLNYYITKGIKPGSYLKPDFDENIIFFENLINWREPIVLCEGVFDAMTVKRNAIPVIGKKLPVLLQNKLITAKVQDVYLAYDADAKKETISYSRDLKALGINVHQVLLDIGDPNEKGFRGMRELIRTSSEFDLKQEVRTKLELL